VARRATLYCLVALPSLLHTLLLAMASDGSLLLSPADTLKFRCA
jgi:hypothetical protein